jgi:predicted SnoaL-like aldol condensation-catalyzing enzyme
VTFRNRTRAAGLWLAGLALAAAATAQLPVETHPDQLTLLSSADPVLAVNKKLVFDFWREVLQAHEIERAPRYLADSYVRHDPSAETSRAALLERFAPLPRREIEDTIDELVSIVAEGDLVVLAFRRELLDLEHEGQTYTTTAFAMFRIVDGKIVEQWDHGALD